MRERQRKIAKELTTLRIDLLAEEADVVRIRQEPVKHLIRFVHSASGGERLYKPEGTR